MTLAGPLYAGAFSGGAAGRDAPAGDRGKIAERLKPRKSGGRAARRPRSFSGEPFPAPGSGRHWAYASGRFVLSYAVEADYRHVVLAFFAERRVYLFFDFFFMSHHLVGYGKVEDQLRLRRAPHYAEVVD